MSTTRNSVPEKQSSTAGGHVCVYKRLFEVLLQDATCTSCLNQAAQPTLTLSPTSDEYDMEVLIQSTFPIHTQFKIPGQRVFSPHTAEPLRLGWTRDTFRGFSVKGKGMVRVSVAHSIDGSQRAMMDIGLPLLNSDGWSEVFWFYAFPEDKSGWKLERIVIGEASSAGGKTCTVRSEESLVNGWAQGWVEKLSLWVPKE